MPYEKEAKITKIIVGVDGSEFSIYAAEQAISITKKYNGLLVALHVLPVGIRNEYFQYNLDEIPLSVKQIIVLYRKEIERLSNKITQMSQDDMIGIILIVFLTVLFSISRSFIQQSPEICSGSVDKVG